ncbi:MGMT family protein [Leptolyngbya sp. FACHB-261]|uniref:MGMT family protein n=1 Tax=Leptolyngbya sp. FACHB-261 TaxID=2692806 RepID=UPI0016831594|nr:MGMT family protein [Leptolyngbya sp. FACHB-261]MBD2103393.1 MGMT family protein [Leptolyngbya sp. FACHB-261]
MSAYEQIYAVVRLIPLGKVATYGQIATLAGLPGHARQVGYALFRVAPGADVPWQRVVNSRGEISYSALRHGSDDIQRLLLEEEGIQFNPNGRIDLRHYGWQPLPLSELATEQSQEGGSKSRL